MGTELRIVKQKKCKSLNPPHFFTYTVVSNKKFLPLTFRECFACTSWKTEQGVRLKTWKTQILWEGENENHGITNRIGWVVPSRPLPYFVIWHAVQTVWNGAVCIFCFAFFIIILINNSAYLVNLRWFSLCFKFELFLSQSNGLTAEGINFIILYSLAHHSDEFTL